MSTYGISLFCDDIRFEQQNKISLIGCYGHEMLIAIPPPISIPKLGILVQIRSPAEKLPERTLLVYGPQSEEPFFKMEVGPNEEQEFVPQINPDDVYEVDSVRLRGAIIPLVFSPFLIEKEGVIRVRMMCGSERVRLGGLRITHRPADQMPGA